MGNLLSNNETSEYDYNKLQTKQEFYNIVILNKTKLHQKFCIEEITINVLLYESFTEKNILYAAKLTTTMPSRSEDPTNIFRRKQYQTHFNYGFDIYKYNKNDINYKQLIVKDYYLCEYKNRKGDKDNMANDLLTINDEIQKVTYDKIKEKMAKLTK